MENQNPGLVRALRDDGRLEARLTESLEMATLVLADAMTRGLNLSQAMELAMDSVALPVKP